MGSFDKLVLWLFGDRKKARDVAERHHATVTANLPTGLEGDAQDGMDGMLYGGVIWPVEPGTHGAKAFLSAWCFLAYYDGQKQECYMLDDLDGTRHPGAIPLKVGKDLKIQSGEKRSGRGMVIRSAEEGEAGQLKNVFQHYEPNLVAHHLPPNQPDNSSQVCDPDADGRKGGLHYPLRVREWVRKFCSGASQAVKEKLFAPLLNMRLKNGDGTDAGGGATFARGEAALSDEAKGPLACANDGNHRLGITDEATIHQGGNAIDVLYGPVAGGLYMPEEVIDTPWVPGSYGPFITRVEKRPDPAAKHKNFCKKDAPGQLKWLNYDTFREFPPAFPPPPPDTPPDQPPPETPPGRPPAMLVPPESPIPPTTGTPYEIESPSQYGHPMPSIPDGPPEAEGEPNAANDNARDAFWLNRFGHTEDAWHRTPITGHRFTVPEYQFSTPRDQGERWPTVKETHELIEYEPDGSVRARIAATGPGSTVEAPAWTRPWHVFKALWQGAWRESQNLLLIMAGESTDGAVVDGRLGLGSRGLTSPFTISGFEFKLDTSTSATEPDLVLSPKNASGAESGAGVFHVQTGVQVDDYLLAGAVGTEADAIRIDNTTTRGRIRASDFGTKAAHIIAHQHSTTVAPKLYLSRSNSDSSSHTAVTNSQELGSVVALGWAHSTPGYLPAAQIKMSVDSGGTVGSGSMPGKIELQTTRDSAKTPTTAVLIDSAQTVFVRQPSSTAPVTVIESAASDGVRRETYLSRAATLSAGVTPVNVLTLAPTEVCRLRVSITAAEESGGTDQDYAYEALLKVTEVSGALSIGTAAVLLNDGSAAFAITYADGGSGVLQINVDDTGAYNMLWNIIIEVDRNTRV